jgi:dTDP-4-amino-4,6-dideoxygalactose transaminase
MTMRFAATARTGLQADAPVTLRIAPPVALDVPLFDVARGFESMRSEALAVFDRLLGSGQFVLGPELAQFEHLFAEFCGAEHCIGVSDGTAALELGLVALGVEAGTQVITVPNTFIATVEAIAAAGAQPVFVDADAGHRCMDPRQLRAALDEETAAVVPVHLFGRLAPMDEISAICTHAGVSVMEDAAQAHGASRDGRRAGAWGDAAGFSFYPTKNLGAAGDAGAVVCASAEVAAHVRSLRHHGSLPGEPNHHVRRGGTHRLDNLQAALLILRLLRLDEENEQRRIAAERYRELLADLPLRLPAEDGDDEQQVYHLFVVELEQRDRVLAALRDRGIGAAVHYPTPIHLQPAWRHLGYARGDFPVAEHLAEHALSLPCFPGITEDEQLRVASALGEILD